MHPWLLRNGAKFSQKLCSWSWQFIINGSGKYKKFPSYHSPHLLFTENIKTMTGLKLRVFQGILLILKMALGNFLKLKIGKITGRAPNYVITHSKRYIFCMSSLIKYAVMMYNFEETYILLDSSNYVITSGREYWIHYSVFDKLT